ncbi:23S rRNA pseudoU1915 N3-methylase RlmH [Bradyrhizobium sp. LM4.3]
MRVAVIAVGRLKQGPERELADRYFERFDEVGRKLGFRELAIHELPESRARDTATRMAEEAAAISAHIPEKSMLVALDERGQNLDSTVFARHLGRWRDEGGRSYYLHDRRGGRTFARIAP